MLTWISTKNNNNTSLPPLSILENTNSPRLYIIQVCANRLWTNKTNRIDEHEGYCDHQCSKIVLFFVTEEQNERL